MADQRQNQKQQCCSISVQISSSVLVLITKKVSVLHSIVLILVFILTICSGRGLPVLNDFSSKVLKCFNQCFPRLRSWKSFSSKTAVDPSSRFHDFETLFQHQSCANYWYNNLKILTKVSFRICCQDSKLSIIKSIYDAFVTYRGFSPNATFGTWKNSH